MQFHSRLSALEAPCNAEQPITCLSPQPVPAPKGLLSHRSLLIAGIHAYLPSQPKVPQSFACGGISPSDHAFVLVCPWQRSCDVRLEGRLQTHFRVSQELETLRVRSWNA